MTEREIEVAHHEAGHAVCFLSFGVPVLRVELWEGGGGQCVPDPAAFAAMNPLERIVCCLAGGAAMTLLGAEPDPSAEDLRHALEAEWSGADVLSDRQRRGLFDAAVRRAWEYEGAVRYLAKWLPQYRTVTQRQLAELAYRPESGLAPLRAACHVPSEASRGPARRTSVAKPSGPWRRVQTTCGFFGRGGR